MPVIRIDQKVQGIPTCTGQEDSAFGGIEIREIVDIQETEAVVVGIMPLQFQRRFGQDQVAAGRQQQIFIRELFHRLNHIRFHRRYFRDGPVFKVQ